MGFIKLSVRCEVAWLRSPTVNGSQREGASRAFKNFRRDCERLHFFRGPSGEEESLATLIREGGTETDIEDHGFSHIGVVVLRPTVSYNVGWVALRFDSRRGMELSNPPPPTDPEYGGIPRCKGESKQEANLLSAALTVQAVPFVQQDVVTGMCATAFC